MGRLRIVADKDIPFLRGALEDQAEIRYLPGTGITSAEVRDADALIVRTRTRCDRSLLEGSSVRMVATATIGHDHIDTRFCEETGIRWVSAPGCNAPSVRQYMVSALLWLAVERGWDLDRMTLGVVGAGHVGSRVAKAAQALGMHVLINDPPREREEGPEQFAPLEELLGSSDAVTLHVPLNREGKDATAGMVNERFLDQLSPGAVLFNTSRGGVVGEPSLLKALGAGTLSGAVLDVFCGEPEPDRKVLEAATLATPHIAGYSLDGKAAGTRAAVRAISRHFGLGCDQWEPGEIPPPAETQLLGDAASVDRTRLLWDLFRETYDITRDHRDLAGDPEGFESLRSGYPLRREPHAYSVRLFQAYPEVVRPLEALGFSVLADHCA